MDSLLETSATPRTDAEYERAIEVMLERMKALNARIAEDGRAIQLLRTETAEIRIRTEHLARDSRAALDRLETLFCP